jgi:uncharacterized membrane protein HdeD (DUF308 family)
MSASPVSESAKSESMNAMLAENWWVLAFRGVFAIVFGLIAFFWPGATMLSLVLLFAVYACADGVAGIISAIRGARRGEQWGWLLLNGILGVLAGTIAILLPSITVLVFVMLVAAWALISGTLMLISAWRLKTSHGRWWLVFGGVCSIIYGVLLFAAPLIGALVLTWWVGAHALVLGVALLILAFKLHRHRNEHVYGVAAH